MKLSKLENDRATEAAELKSLKQEKSIRDQELSSQRTQVDSLKLDTSSKEVELRRVSQQYRVSGAENAILTRLPLIG